MGGAIKRSLISVYILLSAYFPTAQSYKRMRLTTRVYGIRISTVSSIILLTFGACARGSQYLVCVCVCVSAVYKLL